MLDNDKDYNDFCIKIERLLGINLVEYKENQMKRRLRTLLEKKGFDDFYDYFEGIKKDAAIRSEFLDRITINVSEFFRNQTRWAVLEEEILPTLMQKKTKLRIWSAACSTGEEPYTLAMMLANHYPLDKIKIFATDIDETVINKAKKGYYSEHAMRTCPPDYLKRYFKKIGSEYLISEDIRKCVEFKRQDLLKERFESGWDIIVCRNVMIYFTEDAKEKLYHKFADGLAEGGLLFVGSTEQIFQPQKYSLSSEKTFFYRKESNKLR